ncbi:thermonuclease family protein [Anabaena sp. UHCC 0399]|uniref:thermonuclease family protein n=1 Tax=Anabaena sp. UHCC 0399 TaxID=3110238 RepID=UPI002B1F8A01|nr:thermonuclease family protein [Anabaena sp. UHCC 0399]MEA5567819.1 thermonuclease family protein [Anabaena sp. UHCC 0399]
MEGDEKFGIDVKPRGQNVAYRQYFKACASTKDQFLQAEANAKSQKLGFWNQSQPVMPWDFR